MFLLILYFEVILYTLILASCICRLITFFISLYLQTNNIETVFRAVKFTSKFTFKELGERWYSLLYDHTLK